MSIKRVFILDDEKHTRDLLCMVVREHPDLELLVATKSLSDARKAMKIYAKPDVFLIDLGLPDGSGLELIRDIRKNDASIAIMVLSVFGDERHVVDAIEQGAGGYIHKDEPLEDLAQHIKNVLSGDSPISPSIAKHILNRMQTISKPTKSIEPLRNEVLSPLSKRERDVLQVLSRGFNRIEVANHLKVSPHTITTHIKNIYRKLNVHSRTEALFEAYHLGLIGESD